MPRCSYMPTVGISNYRYSLGVKGQGQIRQNLYTTHNTNSSFTSTTKGVHIWHNGCLWGVNYNVGFLPPLCHWCQKTRSNILTISLWLVTRTPPSFFDQGCSYLAQLSLIACKLQSMLHSTAMALGQKLVRICLTVVCF